MSLQVWLPLTKDLKNQGLASITYTGTPTFKSIGKLSNRSLDLSSRLTFNCSALTNKTIFSVCFWAKVNDDSNLSTNWVDVIGFTDISSGGNSGQLRWETCYAEAQATRGISGHDNATYAITQYSAISGVTPVTVKNKWEHRVFTVSSTECIEYVDGEQKATYGVNGGHLSGAFWIGETGKINGEIQDVRIYDHCLSPMEVKQISQGLVLHYPLSSNSIQTLNNCFVYPTFNSSATAAGWYHWGSTGHQGTYGQSTDSNYIYRKGQTYAHWVADGSEATHNYLLYQSPDFEGGRRSLQCICKEENGLPITESIVYPVWNARSGGTTADKWTSITSLGNGFYHCKCENIQQDGSNDLVGFYVRIGYKVYFSEAYLENDKEACADIFYPSNTVYDISGFCNNGIKIGDITVSNDTPKYNISTYLNGSSYLQSIDNTNLSGDFDFTVAFWICADSFTNDYASVVWNGCSSGNYAIAICVPNGKVSLDFWNNRYLTNNVVLASNNWYHVCCTKTAGVVSSSNSHIYINGQEVAATANNYYQTAPNISGSYKWIIGRLNDTSSRYITGKVSDIRIYATALSAEEVLSLYQNSATIDSNGVIHGQIR